MVDGCFPVEWAGISVNACKGGPQQPQDQDKISKLQGSMQHAGKLFSASIHCCLHLILADSNSCAGDTNLKLGRCRAYTEPKSFELPVVCRLLSAAYVRVNVGYI